MADRRPPPSGKQDAPRKKGAPSRKGAPPKKDAPSKKGAPPQGGASANFRAFLPVLVALAFVGLGVYLYSRSDFDRAEPTPEILEPLATPPRPPVLVEPARQVVRVQQGATQEVASLAPRPIQVKERNDLAREHRDLIAMYAEGRVSMQDVEAVELKLLDARHRLGEMDSPTWHRARAVLRARDVERTNLAVDAGMVPAGDLAVARLALELEKFLAGDENEYAADRAAVLAGLKLRQAALIEAGRLSEEAAQEELKHAEVTFPSVASPAEGTPAAVPTAPTGSR